MEKVHTIGEGLFVAIATWCTFKRGGYVACDVLFNLWNVLLREGKKKIQFLLDFICLFLQIFRLLIPIE